MGTEFSLESLEGLRVHFIGVKGTGMAALVEVFCAEGAQVTGSDVAEVFYTDEILRRCGVRPVLFDASNITGEVELVVRSSAYTVENNPEVKAAAEAGLPMLLYSEALGALSRTMWSAAICGVHGKTTTAGMVGTLLKDLPIPSLTLAGSAIASFGGSCVAMSDAFHRCEGGTRFFTAETCEYQRHFMAFSPRAIILTAVESDHEDFYPTFQDIQNAFVDFIRKLPEGGTLIYCADDKGARETAQKAVVTRRDIRLVPYGMSASGAWCITDYRVRDGKQLFNVGAIGEVALSVSGRHNVRNATAALALVSEALKAAGEKVSTYYDRMRQGLLEWRGGCRRSEIVGRARNSRGQEIIFMDDYAHHPTAIRSTLEGYRSFYEGHRIVVDFMSHTYSRTQALLEDFARSFGSADMVVLNDIYPSARESARNFDITGEDLYKCTAREHKNVIYEKDFSEAARAIYDELEKEDSPGGFVFVTMGAGDNFKVGRMVLDMFKEREYDL